MKMAPKRLIVAVEGTAAVGPYWQIIFSDYLDKIIRCFCEDEATGQKTPTSQVELSLVVFNTHGSYSGCLVQRSGWTKDVEIFLKWLSAIHFAGGGFNDAAIAEGLGEALTMLSSPNDVQDPKMDGQRHCILVAASNPYPLPTAVYRPEPSKNTETQPDNFLFNAETLAKSFAECAISLSVISPKKLPKLRSIYNAGKRNPGAVEPPVDNVKNPHFLVLISENLFESQAALSRCGLMNLSSNQNPSKMDLAPVSPVSGPPPTSIPSAIGPVSGRQPLSPGNVPPTIVKVEPNTVIRPASPHISSVPRVASPVVSSIQTSSPSTPQEMIPRNESIHEMKPVVTNMSPSLRPSGGAAANVRILNDVAQARQALSGGTSIGLPSMSGTPMLSSMISSGTGSPIPLNQTVTTATGQVMQHSSPGMSQSLGTLHTSVGMAQPGMSQGGFPMSQMVQIGVGTNHNTDSGNGINSGKGMMVPTPGMQSIGMNSNNTMTNIPMKYIKVWEGNLSGQRQGQPVLISRMEGYRCSITPEKIAADWPSSMQIVRLIPQEHMDKKTNGGHLVIFRAINQHGFLGQLQEKKLCAVIQLPSQTLLLQVSDKESRLIGKIFPEDMVVFKPQVPNQPRLQMQQQQQLMQMQQQQPLMQMQQHARAQIPQQHQVPRLQQQQIMGVGQGYFQSGGRSQVLSQGQMSSQGQVSSQLQASSQGHVSSQGQPTMPGGGSFMS